MIRENVLKAVLQGGATKAVCIKQAQIVLSAEFRRICEANQCGGYPRAVLYQTIHYIEDRFDIEGMFEAGKRHAHTSAVIEKALRRTGRRGADAAEPGTARENAGNRKNGKTHPPWRQPGIS